MLECKWPKIFTIYLVPFIVPSQCVSLLNITRDTGMQPVLGNLTGNVIFLILGFLMNFNWIVSAITMTISTLVMMVYYIVYIQLRDIQTISIIISMLLILIYACYYYEKKLKLLHIQMHQIQTMNDELK